MNNVVSIFEKKEPKSTPEQHLKLFCLEQIMGADNMEQILQRMTIDEAFGFIAEQAVEKGDMPIDAKLMIFL